MTPEQIDAVALKCSNSYWAENGSRFNHDFARAIEAEARRDALEEAAKVCESQWSNVAEKLYGIECAAVIRKLKEDIQ